MTAAANQHIEAALELPDELVPVFEPAPGTVRVRGAYGGRGSGKTRTFALMAAVRGYQLAQSGQRGVILCGREFQNSLDESSMEEVKIAILSEPWLAAFYDIGEKYIRTRCGSIRFIFAGLRHNLDSIKSKARILLCWLDEADPISEVAYRKLIPTIREAGSELWVTWNPEIEGSPTDQRFRKNSDDDMIVVEIQWWHNPWFKDTALAAERERDERNLEPDMYAHVWEGEYLKNSEAQILRKKVRVAEFVARKSWDGPYHGLDFGFSQDPTAAVRCWIDDDRLMVDFEGGDVGLELDETAEFLINRIPGLQDVEIRADSARPESISYLRRKDPAGKRPHLPRIKSVEKWKGSVEDGIKFLRSFREIVIHPRCRALIKETRKYSYKVDRLSGEVTSIIIDADNHYIDALRYALAPIIKRKRKRAGAW